MGYKHVSTRQIDNGHITSVDSSDGESSTVYSKNPPKVTVEYQEPPGQASGQMAMTAAKMLLNRSNVRR